MRNRVLVEGLAERRFSDETVRDRMAQPPANPHSDGFERWYAAEFPRVVRALAASGVEPSLAADAAAEAFVRAWAAWNRVAAMASPGGWVFRVATNVAKRSWRRREIERRLLMRSTPELLFTAPADPDDELRALVAQLPRPSREVIGLRYGAGWSEIEIAHALGVPEGTVSARLTRARRALRTELEKCEGNAT